MFRPPFNSTWLANTYPISRYSESRQVEKLPYRPRSCSTDRLSSISLAAIRYELGNDHEYEFVEGCLPWPTAPGTYVL